MQRLREIAQHLKHTQKTIIIVAPMAEIPMLLGLIRKGDGLAFQTLQNIDVDPDLLRDAIEERLAAAPASRMKIGLFKRNPEADRVLEAAKQIALQLKHGWVGTEHLLLGLLRADQGVAGRRPTQSGIDFDKAKEEVIAVIEGTAPGTAAYRGNWTRLPLRQDVSRILLGGVNK